VCVGITILLWSLEYRFGNNDAASGRQASPQLESHTFSLFFPSTTCYSPHYGQWAGGRRRFPSHVDFDVDVESSAGWFFPKSRTKTRPCIERRSVCRHLRRTNDMTMKIRHRVPALAIVWISCGKIIGLLHFDSSSFLSSVSAVSVSLDTRCTANHHRSDRIFIRCDLEASRGMSQSVVYGHATVSWSDYMTLYRELVREQRIQVASLHSWCREPSIHVYMYRYGQYGVCVPLGSLALKWRMFLKWRSRLVSIGHREIIIPLQLNTAEQHNNFNQRLYPQVFPSSWARHNVISWTDNGVTTNHSEVRKFSGKMEIDTVPSWRKRNL